VPIAKVMTSLLTMLLLAQLVFLVEHGQTHRCN